MKKSGLYCFISVFAAGLIILVSYSADAEIIFKKDGSIINGRVTVDSAASLTIVTTEGKRETIPRNQIMRVLYTKIYLGKVFIRLTNGTTQDGYVVDEDQDNYFVRKVLNNIEELKIPRSKVMFIARSNPTDLVGVAERTRVKLKWSAPYIPGKNYKVYARQVKEKEYKLVNEVTGESCSVAGLRSNTKYSVYVTSVDNEGIESVPSDQVEVLTLNNPPSKVGSLRKTISDGSAPGFSNITLEWDPATDIDGDVTEYRIFSRDKHSEYKQAGTSKKNQFILKDVELKKTKQLAIRAVDNTGDMSDYSNVFSKPVTITLEPRMAFPLGKMGDLFGFGFGARTGAYLSDVIFDDTILGVDIGYLYFTEKNKSIKSMNMFSFIAFAGYRYYFTDRISLSASLGGGYVYMSTKYTNAAFQSKTMSAWEPVFTGKLSGEYSPIEKLYVFGAFDYTTVYEPESFKSFIGVSFGAGYRIF